jgi:hypothetical protein
MKAVLSLAVLAALTTLAQAQDTRQDAKPEPKGIETKSPWSVTTTDRSDGYFGSQSTTIKRDIGDGWSLGGKLTTPYEDPAIGGSGAPGLKQYESPGNTTTFGPVFEKKF